MPTTIINSRQGRVTLAARAALILFLVSGGGAFAQAPEMTAPAPTPASASDKAAPPVPTTTGSAQTGASSSPITPASGTSTGMDGTASSTLEYLYNRKPQEGTAAAQVAGVTEQAKAKAIARDAMGVERIDNPSLKARFDKFLALPAVSSAELQQYEETSDQLRDLLRQRLTFEAWKRLFVLAEYDAIDAGVSRELANRIESIWNNSKATTALARDNERLRDEIKGASRNADMLAEGVRQREVAYQRKLTEGRNTDVKRPGQRGEPEKAPPLTSDAGGAPSTPGAPNIDSVIGKLQLTDAYLRNLESSARIKLNELQSESLVEQARQNFASYITTLFESGRHRHVILAADFYRQVFNSTEYPVAMANQVNAALEMARDLSGTVEVVKYKVESRELAAATTQLQQAFVANELHPALLGLDREKKEAVAKFCDTLDRMQNLIEAREFTDLDALLATIGEQATDFDATKVRAMVKGVQLESQLRLGKAKLAAQQGNLDQAMKEFQTAAEVWPNNPDLKDKALTFFDSQDIQSEAVREFDRMVKDGNYRGIFEKQLAFAPALRDDVKRQEQMREALEKVKVAEMASEKAELLNRSGDPVGAWETVELAVADLPDDLKLNALRGELSGRSAEFVAAINKARDAEEREELGFSLSWYASAQRQYPASLIANAAIERLSSKILDEATH